MTLEHVTARLRHELAQSDGSVDVSDFVATFGIHDIEAGQYLERMFRAGLLRGRFVSRLVEFDGHISAISDRTRPVWH